MNLGCTSMSSKRKLSVASSSQPSKRKTESPQNSEEYYYTAQTFTNNDNVESPRHSTQSASEVLWKWNDSPQTQRLREEMKSKWKYNETKGINKVKVSSLAATSSTANKNNNNSNNSGISRFKLELEKLQNENVDASPSIKRESITRSFSFAESDGESEVNSSWRKHKSTDLSMKFSNTPQKPQVISSKFLDDSLDSVIIPKIPSPTPPNEKEEEEKKVKNHVKNEAPQIVTTLGNIDSDDDFEDVISTLPMNKIESTKSTFDRHQSMPATSLQSSTSTINMPTQRKICTKEEIEEKRQKALAILKQKQAMKQQINCVKQ